MLKFLCVVLLLIGAAIHADNLYRSCATLRHMREQAYETNILKHWVYQIFIGILAFFFVGYLIAAAAFLYMEYHPSAVLIAAMLLLFALFALCMVRSIQIMSRRISKHTSEVIHALIVSIEAKDQYTMGHSKHVMQLCELIHEALPEEMQGRINLQMLRDAALLHDIGKLRVPDRILQKPGRLNDQEMRLIRQHPKFGHDMLDHSSFSHVAKWVLYHHERADGCGYYRIPADEVPIEAKILAVADTYSALSTDRSYHSRLKYSQAVEIMTAVAGTQLDAQLVDVFCRIDQTRIDGVAPRFDWEISLIDVHRVRQPV